MKIYKRAAALVTVLALVLAALTGCHGSRGRAEFQPPLVFDEYQKIELSFWAKNDTNKTQTKIYEKAIDDFEKLYPNIEIKLRLYTDYGKLYNDVITNISTNTTPNVCITYPDHIATYMTGDNVVVSLDALIADEKYGLDGSSLKFDGPSKEEIVPQFLSECSIGGSTYALPFMRSTEACYINKTFVEKLGYELTYLDVDAYGVIDLAQLREVLREDTTLVSVMTGNNEIGTIEPLDAVASMLRGTGTLFHTDAVQAIGQIPLSMNQLPVDYLSASAHKFHGPKGVGFLFVRKDRDLPSYIHGGSQENGKRAGTENVAGIVGMAKALEIAVEEMQVVRPRIVRLRNYFVERVLREIPQGRLNGHPHKRLPGNVNFSFEGIDATSLLVLLEEDGICASAGSACNTGQTRISHVIEAIHVPKNYAPGSVRFTMGRETDRRQVDAVIASLKKNIGLLRGE